MGSHSHHQRRYERSVVFTGFTRVGIICTAAVVLGLSIHRGLGITAAESSRVSVSSWTTSIDQEECIYHAIRAELPKGTAVFIEEHLPYFAQMLTELATPWAVPQARSATANWVMSLTPGRECSGESLVVRRD
jgi:hypothetical protein